VREREDANRTREAGNLDEIQGVVAISLKFFRQRAAKPRVLRFTLVGFIDWLDATWLFCILESLLKQLFAQCEHEADDAINNSVRDKRDAVNNDYHDGRVLLAEHHLKH
jgi:hypothetical protein